MKVGGRRGRLQAKMARYIAFAVVTSLMVSMVGLVLYRYFSMRQALEESARNFAALVRMPLVQVTVMYGESGLQDPVKAWVGQLMELDQDIESIEIVKSNGSPVLTASRGKVEAWPLESSAPTIHDLELLEIIYARSKEAARVKVDGRSVYRIVIPGEDDGRSYTLSLVAVWSYDRIQRQLARGGIFLGIALILGLIVAERVAAGLAHGITRNLDELQAGVRRIRAGRLDVRVKIRSEDEVQELAEAFNGMTEDFQQSIERLRSANQELQALDQVKANLVANVSHELRTPLTALKGFLELLDEGELGPLGEEAQRAISVCRRNVDRLALRVEDLVQLEDVVVAQIVVLGQDDLDLVAADGQLATDAEHHVRKPAHLGYRSHFRRDMDNVEAGPVRVIHLRGRRFRRGLRCWFRCRLGYQFQCWLRCWLLSWLWRGYRLGCRPGCRLTIANQRRLLFLPPLRGRLGLGA